MPIIGIDLGTTNSLACICQNGRPKLIPNALGRFLTPSAVSVREDGSVCGGGGKGAADLLPGGVGGFF